MRMPMKIAATKATFVETLAASASVAPMRFATRVEAAMERGKGIWKVSEVMVARTDCAASVVVPK